MKNIKCKKIISIIVFILIVLQNLVIFADNLANISVIYQNKNQEQEKNIIRLKVNSSIPIGVISGKIEPTENIDIIQVVGLNNWNLTYNDKTGDFNIYKAEGAKEEEIIELTYKRLESKENLNNKIVIQKLKLTNIEYNQNKIENFEIDLSQNRGNNQIKQEKNNRKLNNKIVIISLIVISLGTIVFLVIWLIKNKRKNKM